MMLLLFKVTFQNPRRIFYLRAKDRAAALVLAKEMEEVLEKLSETRERSLTDVLIRVVTEGEDE